MVNFVKSHLVVILFCRTLLINTKTTTFSKEVYKMNILTKNKKQAKLNFTFNACSNFSV